MAGGDFTCNFRVGVDFMGFGGCGVFAICVVFVPCSGVTGGGSKFKNPCLGDF